MLDPWVVLLAYAAVWSDGPAPAGWEDRPGFAEAVALVVEAEGWSGPGEVRGLAPARDLRERLRDAPGLWVLDAAPPEAWLDEQVCFARGHLTWIEGQRALYGPAWDDWAADAERLRRGYWSLSMAHWMRRSGGVASAREYLADAARDLGRGAVEAGVLPPVVPLERFTRR